MFNLRMKKKLLWIVSLISLVAVQALAHPGSHTLSCRSVKTANSKSIEFSLRRSNGPGWFAPGWTVMIDKKKYNFEPTDENKDFGETIRDVPLGVIYITADNMGDGESNQGSFSLMAIPGSLRMNGQPPKWNFKNEKDQCYDSNGKATFSGIFRGTLVQGAGKQLDLDLGPVLMSCKLEYDSGMAC
jgi:hypothetical protein